MNLKKVVQGLRKFLSFFISPFPGSWPSRRNQWRARSGHRRKPPHKDTLKRGLTLILPAQKIIVPRSEESLVLVTKNPQINLPKTTFSQLVLTIKMSPILTLSLPWVPWSQGSHAGLQVTIRLKNSQLSEGTNLGGTQDRTSGSIKISRVQKSVADLEFLEFRRKNERRAGIQGRRPGSPPSLKNIEEHL